MIAVEFSGFVVVVLIVALSLIGGIWIGSEIRQHRRQRRVRDQMLNCPLCGLDFYDDSPRTLVDCPLCQSRVERGAIRRSGL